MPVVTSCACHRLRSRLVVQPHKIKGSTVVPNLRPRYCFVMPHRQHRASRALAAALAASSLLSSCTSSVGSSTGPGESANSTDSSVCAGAEVGPEKANLIILIDHTADERPLSLPTEVRDAIAKTILDGDGLSIGIIQGAAHPDRFWQFREIGLGHPKRNSENLKKQAKIMSDCIVQKALEARPAESGTDLSSALVAAGELASDKVKKDRLVRIMVISNGLSNHGNLDLRKYASMDISAKDSAAFFIHQAGVRIPDLTGTALIFFDLGQVANDSPQIGDLRRLWLEEFWTELCYSAKASTCLASRDHGGGTPALTGLPADSPVSFNDPTPDGPHAPSPTPSITNPCRPTLPSEELFAPGSAVLARGVEERLEPIAAKLRATGLYAEIQGHTASWGSISYRKKLSEQRAGAIKQALIRLRVPSQQLKAVGYGSLRRVANDLSRDGQLIEPQASMNRRIVIVFEEGCHG
jgi:outer membrane protein OmpA-like peptidoglycan-associated protein